MAYLAGIEIGTREYKVGIYDENSNLAAFASEPVRIAYFVDQLHPDWSFWKPEEVWAAVVRVVQRALRQLDRPWDVRAVSLTGVGLDGLPVDKNGEPLYPIISWQCNRAAKQSEEFLGRVSRSEVFQITGNQVMANHSIYRFMWIKEKYPVIYEKTYKWLMIEDYVNFKLCGEFATDKSLACTTSMYDVGKQCWAEDILEKAGLDLEKMAEVKESGTVLGKISRRAARETGLSEDTMIVLGGHDYMCAALAAQSLHGESVVDMVGSWEMMIAGTDMPVLNENIYHAGFMVANQVTRGRYAVVGETVSSSMVDWFRDQVVYSCTLEANEKKKEIAWRNLCALAERNPPISKGVFFLPHCFGAGAPTPDSKSSGIFLGLSDLTDTSDMLSAVIEGLNFQFRNMLDSLEKAMAIDISTIVCIGEDTVNTSMMQNKADVTGMCVEVPSIDSVTTFGASILAGLGCGIYHNCKEATGKIQERVLYEPNLEHVKRYDEGFALYRKIYTSVKDLNHEVFSKFRFLDG